MNPYGITQVDIPGVLRAYESTRLSRIREMREKRLFDREEREHERKERFRSDLSKVYEPDGADGPALPLEDFGAQRPGQHGRIPSRAPAGMGGIVGKQSRGGIADVVANYGADQVGARPPDAFDRRLMEPGDEALARAPDAPFDPENMPKRKDGLRLNFDAVRNLYILYPEEAPKIGAALLELDKKGIEAARRRGEGMAKSAIILSDVNGATPEETVALRRAKLADIQDDLVAYGYDAPTDEQIAQADLSDQGLGRYLAFGQTLNDLVDDRRADRRLDADIANIEEDNERADRNTSSLITDRQARLGLTRRGQDISSSDRRYSANIADTRGRRGQDMTDKRVREGFGGGGGRKKGGAAATGTAANPVSVQSPAEARKLKSGTYFKTPDNRIKMVP